MVATPVTMQGVVRTPAGGARQTTVLVDLIVDPGQTIGEVGYVDANDYEVVASVAVTADPDTGVWSTPLYANADVRPAGTYYRARYVVDGIEHPAVYFQATAGGGWIGDHLVSPPGSLPDAASSGRLVAKAEIKQNVVTSTTTPADLTGAALTIPVGTRPILVEFYAPLVQSDTADRSVNFYLYDLDLSTLWVASFLNIATAGKGGAHLCRRWLDPLPAPGLHNYGIKWAMGEAGGTRTVAGAAPFLDTTAVLSAVEH